MAQYNCAMVTICPHVSGELVSKAQTEVHICPHTFYSKQFSGLVLCNDSNCSCGSLHCGPHHSLGVFANCIVIVWPELCQAMYAFMPN